VDVCDHGHDRPGDRTAGDRPRNDQHRADGLATLRRGHLDRAGPDLRPHPPGPAAAGRRAGQPDPHRPGGSRNRPTRTARLQGPELAVCGHGAARAGHPHLPGRTSHAGRRGTGQLTDREAGMTIIAAAAEDMTGTYLNYLWLSLVVIAAFAGLI